MPGAFPIGAQTARERHLVRSALALATVLLLEAFLVLWLISRVFHQSLAEVQTLVFLMLVFSGQTTIYVVRVRGFFWSSRPGTALLVASLGDLLVVSGFAAFGILMAPVSPLLIGVTLALALAFMVLLDQGKRLATRRLAPVGRAR